MLKHRDTMHYDVHNEPSERIGTMGTTTEDVRRAFALLQQTWKRNGMTKVLSDGTVLDYRTLWIVTGSPTYGRAWRLYYRHPSTGGLYDAVPDLANGYLGRNKAEAEWALRMIAVGMGLVER